MLLSIILILICLLVYLFISFTEKHIDKIIKKTDAVNELHSELLKLELAKRIEILTRVESFLASSSFVKPLGTWHNETVYQFIVNKDSVYEFFDFQTKDKSKIGINEHELCFGQTIYKRI